MNLNPNALTQMSEEQHKAVADLLHFLHEVGLKKNDLDDADIADLVGNLERPEVLCGLEFVCQALGVPGYEWS